MDQERGEASEGKAAKGAKGSANGFFGSLKDALLAAGREESPAADPSGATAAAPIARPPPIAPAGKPLVTAIAPASAAKAGAETPVAGLSAEDAARLARANAMTKPIAKPAEPTPPVADAPPTTRVIRPERAPVAPAPAADTAPRTQLVRGKQKIERAGFERDPVVGFLVVVGGPGLGAHRPIFEGNNTLGRGPLNRIPLDFGDDAISTDAQAYLRYDSNDRSFLFVPNLAKTNVVSVNDKRPTAAVELKAMDVVTLGRTQVAFVPFCGTDFDWSEITET